jgi:hypothetical protein
MLTGGRELADDVFGLAGRSGCCVLAIAGDLLDAHPYLRVSPRTRHVVGPAVPAELARYLNHELAADQAVRGGSS